MIKKGSFKHVESELYAYPDTRREIERIKAEILGTREQDDNVGGGRSSLPGDPTGQLAVALVSNRKLETLQLIADVIDIVYCGLPAERQKLLKLKYWTKPQRLTWDGIAGELHISRRQALRWRDAIVREIAVKMGWR